MIPHGTTNKRAQILNVIEEHDEEGDVGDSQKAKSGGKKSNESDDKYY